MLKLDSKTEDRRSDADEDEIERDFDGPEDTIETDNVGEPSVEIDLNTLMAEVEAEGISFKPVKESDKRKRLEEMLEQKRMERELRELENFDFE
jgi:hypothetical protein